jgi:hypothetical protein
VNLARCPEAIFRKAAEVSMINSTGAGEFPDARILIYANHGLINVKTA